MAGDKGWWSREVMFRAAVDPLRCAVHASRPGVAMPGHPFDACVSPMQAAHAGQIVRDMARAGGRTRTVSVTAPPEPLSRHFLNGRLRAELDRTCRLCYEADCTLSAAGH
jgi:hypothetical protein